MLVQVVMVVSLEVFGGIEVAVRVSSEGMAVPHPQQTPRGEASVEVGRAGREREGGVVVVVVAPTEASSSTRCRRLPNHKQTIFISKPFSFQQTFYSNWYDWLP
jgi:hypothetical protein